MDLLMDLKRRLERDVGVLKDYLSSQTFPDVGDYRDVQGRINALNITLTHIDEIVERVRIAEGD